MKCTNVIGGKCRRPISLWNSIYANLSSTKCLPEMKSFWKTGSLFSYPQCNFEVPKNLPESLANFPPIFKSIDVGRDDIGQFVSKYAKFERLLTQPRRLLSSS